MPAVKRKGRYQFTPADRKKAARKRYKFTPADRRKSVTARLELKAKCLAVRIKPKPSKLRIVVERYEPYGYDGNGPSLAELKRGHATAERWLKQPDLAAEVRRSLKPHRGPMLNCSCCSKSHLRWLRIPKPVTEMTPAEIKRELGRIARAL
jgi:hypothetical protein